MIPRMIMCHRLYNNLIYPMQGGTRTDSPFIRDSKGESF